MGTIVDTSKNHISYIDMSSKKGNSIEVGADLELTYGFTDAEKAIIRENYTYHIGMVKCIQQLSQFGPEGLSELKTPRSSLRDLFDGCNKDSDKEETSPDKPASPGENPDEKTDAEEVDVPSQFSTEEAGTSEPNLDDESWVIIGPSDLIPSEEDPVEEKAELDSSVIDANTVDAEEDSNSIANGDTCTTTESPATSLVHQSTENTEAPQKAEKVETQKIEQVVETTPTPRPSRSRARLSRENTMIATAKEGKAVLEKLDKSPEKLAETRQETKARKSLTPLKKQTAVNENNDVVEKGSGQEDDNASEDTMPTVQNENGADESLVVEDIQMQNTEYEVKNTDMENSSGPTRKRARLSRENTMITTAKEGKAVLEKLDKSPEKLAETRQETKSRKSLTPLKKTADDPGAGEDVRQTRKRAASSPATPAFKRTREKKTPK